MALGVDQQQLRALSHPLRLRILSLLTGAAMSSAELARELELGHAAVSFHVRKLVQAGYLELAESRSVRGGKERRYRQSGGSGRRGWQHEDPVLAVRAAAEEIVRRASTTTAEAWRLFGDAELWVDPAVWEEIVTRTASAISDLHAAAQPPNAAGAVHVSASAMLFAIDTST